MPKATITPFTFYSFRYDLDGVHNVKILDYIKREFPKYAIFKEEGEITGKFHYQGKIGKNISLVQLKKNILKEFNLNGKEKVLDRSNYSIAVIMDIDKYDSYICKDGEPVLNNVFSEDFILEQVDKHKTILATKKEKKEEFMKKKKINWTQEIVSDYKKEHPEEVKRLMLNAYKNNDMNALLTKKHLLRYTLKRMGSLTKTIDKHIIERIFNGLILSLIHTNSQSLDDATEHFAEMLGL